MVKAMYSGVSGLRAHQSKMDVIGNNIANVSTWGYKAMSASFKESVYQTMISGSSGSTNDGGYGGVNPSMVGYGSMVSAISSNFTSGNQVYTGQGLDCYIDGTAFFAVGPIYGGGNEEKTVGELNVSRVGNFGIVNDFLVDSNGRYIYGFNMTGGVTYEDKKDANGKITDSPDMDGFTDTDGLYKMNADVTAMKPIKLPTKLDTGEELDLTSFSIQSDGKLYGLDMNSGKTLLLGCIGLVNVQNPNGLTKADGPYYSTGGSSGTATIIQPGGKTGKLLSNYLESANVDIANEFSEMITTQRGFQANSKIITVTDEMLEQLVNMKR